MEEHGSARTILGIVLLYTVFTNLFLFLGKITIWIIMNYESHSQIKFYSFLSILWVIVLAGILLLLFWYSKKYKCRLSIDMLEDCTIRQTVGLLILIDALIKLSTTLPTSLYSFSSSLSILKQFGNSQRAMIYNTIWANLMQLGVLVLQMMTGVYLTRFYQNKRKMS